MGFVIAVAVAVVVLAAVVFVQFNRRERVAVEPPTEDHHRRPIEPMIGLESALAQVTDRSGRPMQDRLADESGLLDDLRVPDDTGPLLRRALDHVAPTEPEVGSPTASWDEPTGEPIDRDSE